MKIALFFSQVLHSKTTKQRERQTQKVFLKSTVHQPVNIQSRNPEKKETKEKRKSLAFLSSLGRDGRELKKRCQNTM